MSISLTSAISGTVSLFARPCLHVVCLGNNAVSHSLLIPTE